jgi:type IV pilus assembly protein PilC
MPVYQFEAMDAAGQEIRDEIDAANEEEAQTTIRQMGYFVTKISVKKTGSCRRWPIRQEAWFRDW